MLTVEEMRLYERLGQRHGVSFAEMTERAGAGCFRWLKRQGAETDRFLLLCGSGGNGADALVLARLLSEAGGRVQVLPVFPPASSLAVELTNRLTGLPVSFLPPDPADPAVTEAMRQADWIVDGVYGIGFHGELPPLVRSIFRLAAAAPGKKLALDLPSGLDAKTGSVAEGLLPAAVTFCFGAKKTVHAGVAGKAVCGRQVVVPLSLPDECMRRCKLRPVTVTRQLVRQRLPRRAADSHKGTYGRLLNLSGSAEMVGAAMMSTLSAMRAGAGITYLAAPASAAAKAAGHLMEAMTLSLPETAAGTAALVAADRLTALAATGVSCTLIGCGLGQQPETASLVALLVKALPCPLVLDADGLNSLQDDPDVVAQAAEPPILTPHPGEMARLLHRSTAEVLQAPAQAAMGLALRLSAVVVLKGHRTLIALPDGRLFENRTGNPGLAKGGSGDVLAGLIAGLRAQGLSADAAAICGVYLHGLCADRLCRARSDYGLLARDLIAELPFAMKAIGR